VAGGVIPQVGPITFKLCPLRLESTSAPLRSLASSGPVASAMDCGNTMKLGAGANSTEVPPSSFCCFLTIVIVDQAFFVFSLTV